MWAEYDSPSLLAYLLSHIALVYVYKWILYDLFGRVVHIYMGIRCSASTGLLYGRLWAWGDDCVLGLGWGQGTPHFAPQAYGSRGSRKYKRGPSLEYLKRGRGNWEANPFTHPTML